MFQCTNYCTTEGKGNGKGNQGDNGSRFLATFFPLSPSWLTSRFKRATATDKVMTKETTMDTEATMAVSRRKLGRYLGAELLSEFLKLNILDSALQTTMDSTNMMLTTVDP